MTDGSGDERGEPLPTVQPEATAHELPQLSSMRLSK